MATPPPGDAAQPILVASLEFQASVSGAAVVSDASPTEQHEGKNTITSHPVEEGSDITDHTRPEPDRLTVEMYVSDTPISVDQTQRAQRFMQQSGLGASASSSGQQQIAGVPGYARAVRDRLQQYRLQGTLLTVVTAIKTYGFMLIESINETRTAEDGGGAFHAQIVFQFVRVVQNQLTRRVQAKDKRVGTKSKTGNQPVQKDKVEQSQLDKGYEAAKGKSGADAVSTFTKTALGLGGG